MKTAIRLCSLLLFLFVMSSCSDSVKCKKNLNASGIGQKEGVDYISMFNSKKPLSTCSKYRISDFRPEFDSVLHEGNVAYYGLIAQAQEDSVLAKKVADVSTKSNLWEYGYGYGATSADSAIVLEALIQLDVRREKIDKSLDSMIVKYYDNRQGCFKTVEGIGRAKYWKGCSAGVTAHIGFLLNRFNSDKYRDIIEKCADYVSKNRGPKGLWSSRWFPSFTVPTYYSIRLLKNFKDKYKDIISKAVDAVKTSQNEDGSWSGSVIETSAAVLTLKLVKEDGEVFSEAEKWLKNNDNSSPEPILFYWFEKRRHKMFFSCYDDGDISLAWKKIALNK